MSGILIKKNGEKLLYEPLWEIAVSSYLGLNKKARRYFDKLVKEIGKMYKGVENIPIINLDKQA